jgi:dephospho-CoA kinase
MSAEEAGAEGARRMAAQMPEADKARMADYVISNSGSREEAEERVKEIWRELVGVV